MLNEENNNLIPMTETEVPALTDKEALQQLLLQIKEAKTKDELMQQFDAFNLAQGKKNALRIAKLDELMDKLEDQAIQRISARPGQISNKELLEYMQTVSAQMTRAQQNIDTLVEKPMINVKNQNNEVNINVGPQLDRASKDKVIDVVAAIINQLNNQAGNPSVIDVTDLQTEGQSTYEIDLDPENETEENN